MVKTVQDDDFNIVNSDKEFTYQNELTSKLDRNTNLFNQDIINEIVLWKVNRYAKLEDETLLLINEIEIDSIELDIEKTKEILKKLLLIKGIQLPMASTILRFRNKNIYQIIDQRVFRIIYQGKTLKISTYLSEKNINGQIDIYIKYLSDLRIICQELQIPFCDADRILYMADKRINVSHKLKNY
jgi:hypothetical protein